MNPNSREEPAAFTEPQTSPQLFLTELLTTGLCFKPDVSGEAPAGTRSLFSKQGKEHPPCLTCKPSCPGPCLHQPTCRGRGELAARGLTRRGLCRRRPGPTHSEPMLVFQVQYFFKILDN